jgi:hypothetical protein
MRDAERLTLDGFDLITWRSAAASRKFDTEGFKKDYPLYYEKYLKAFNGSRRFLVKTPQE